MRSLSVWAVRGIFRGRGLTALTAIGVLVGASACAGGDGSDDRSTQSAQPFPATPTPSNATPSNGAPSNGAPENAASNNAGSNDTQPAAVEGSGEGQNPELPIVDPAPPSTANPAPGEPPETVPDGAVMRPAGTDSAGFFVSGGRLYDHRGNEFVMRGVNNPLAWFQNRNTGALAWLAQIAATGANAVRLVWETDAGDPQLLRDAVARSLELRMVPMIEMHDVTGGTTLDGPASMARYYTETDAVKQILLDYEDSLLVNIANEWTGADNIFVQAYTDAINVFRNAGIRHTLVIDSNGWGQRANTVLTQGQALLDVDPQHNLLFSVHMYEEFRNAQTIRDTLQRAADAKLPLIVGEFGFQHGNNQGMPYPIPYDVLLAESARLGIGYLAWSWTGNSGGVEYLDLTARSGSAEALSAWGDGVINGANGIRATAEPASIFLE